MNKHTRLTLSIVAVSFVLSSHNATTLQGQAQASDTDRNVIELPIPLPGAPVRITSIQVDDKEVNGHRFSAPDGEQWLTHLKVTVQNETSHVIDGITYILVFPESASENKPPIGYVYGWGATVSKKKNPLNSWDKGPITSLKLKPGQAATIDLGSHFDDYASLLRSSHLGNVTPSRVELDVSRVDFADNISWSGNKFFRPTIDGTRPQTVDPTEMFQ